MDVVAMPLHSDYLYSQSRSRNHINRLTPSFQYQHQHKGIDKKFKAMAFIKTQIIVLLLALVLSPTTVSGRSFKTPFKKIGLKHHISKKHRSKFKTFIAPLPRYILTAPKYFKKGCGASAYGAVKDAIRTAVRDSEDPERWPARFLQLAFHDCLPRSCDASIKFELERRANMGLDTQLNLLENVIEGTCVNLSDAIKIGLELSMELSGGPPVICPLGNLLDAKAANPEDKLPSPRDEFDTIIADFTIMGFTMIEALAGNYGGHSLGRFRTRDENDQTVLNPFTPNPDTFSAEYAQFIVTQAPAPGFNDLQSDNTLFNNPRSAPFVQAFAANEYVLREYFYKFISKMCSI